jgi:hypothetical protein
MHYIIWQQAHSPASVVGSVEAASLREAADIARAMWGSFTVVSWLDATPAERDAAIRQNHRADALEAASVMT